MLPGILPAQKDTYEIIEAENIAAIHIDTDEVYLIKITTADISEVRIKTHSEGEYFNNILLKSFVSGTILNLHTTYPQRLSGGYDKLSAHKVFSLEVEMIIPEHLEVRISSNIASVETKGSFKSFYADLKQGYCNLLDFSGNAVVNTYSGHINVETEGAAVEATSRNGRVEMPDGLSGENHLKLTSIDGDIMLRKTK